MKKEDLEKLYQKVLRWILEHGEPEVLSAIRKANMVETRAPWMDTVDFALLRQYRNRRSGIAENLIGEAAEYGSRDELFPIQRWLLEQAVAELSNGQSASGREVAKRLQDSLQPPTVTGVLMESDVMLNAAVDRLPRALFDEDTGRVTCPECGDCLNDPGSTWTIEEGGYQRSEKVEPLTDENAEEMQIFAMTSVYDAYGECGVVSWVECSRGHEMKWFPEDFELNWS